MIEIEVGVAGALAAAVHRALHLARADLDRGERVRDAALGVVVAVDADAHAVAERADRGARRRRRSATAARSRWCRRATTVSAPACGGRADAAQRVVAASAR